MIHALALSPADSVLALVALLGTIAAMVVIRARSTPDGLATRFLLAFALVAGILVTRLLSWHVFAPFDFVGRVIAAWIPLGALLVLEGLERRHAPKPVKWAALVAGGLCSVLASFRPNSATRSTPCWGCSSRHSRWCTGWR